MSKLTGREKKIQYELVKYINLLYAPIRPLIFSDLAGVSFSKAQRAEYKLRSKDSYPDLMLFEPNGTYSALMLELKAEGTRIFKKTGEPSSLTIAKQILTQNRLNERGYYACFAVGLDAAIKIVNKYYRNQI